MSSCILRLLIMSVCCFSVCEWLLCLAVVFADNVILGSLESEWLILLPHVQLANNAVIGFQNVSDYCAPFI